jgi:hypothetical protein
MDQKILKVSHTSQLEPLLFSKNASLKISGNSAKIEEISLVSLSDKLFSLVLNIPTQVLAYMLGHMILTTLAPFMDKIIEAYHGHKPSDKHLSSMDYN